MQENQMSEKKKANIMHAPLMILLFIVIGSLCLFLIYETVNYIQFVQLRNKVDTNTFYPGTTINGISVSGMTLNEAVAKFNEKEQAYTSQLNIQVALDDKTWEISAEDVGLGDTASDVIRKAYSVGRYGTLEERSKVIDLIAQNGQNFEATHTYDKNSIMNIAQEIAANIDVPAADAVVEKFDAKSKKFVISESKNGLKGDADKLYQSILAILDSGEIKETIGVETMDVEPKLTKEQLQKKFKLIASAKTKTTDIPNRNMNINIASKAINAVKVEPGKVFSFNKTTGNRTAARGYKVAGVISGGVLTEDIAGGTCQVSTTLFNAAAKADLEIVERNAHSIKSGYVAIGLDAAVSPSSQDFKFKNNRSTPVYIMAWYEDYWVHVEIYGEALPEGIEIKLKSKEHETREPTGTPKIIVNKDLAPGEVKVIAEPRTGRSASTYRVYYKDGKEIDRVFLFKSIYPAFNGLNEVGPATK